MTIHHTSNYAALPQATSNAGISDRRHADDTVDSHTNVSAVLSSVRILSVTDCSSEFFHLLTVPLMLTTFAEPLKYKTRHCRAKQHDMPDDLRGLRHASRAAPSKP